MSSRSPFAGLRAARLLSAAFVSSLGLAAWLVWPSAAAAQDLAALQKQIEDLEERIEALEAPEEIEIEGEGTELQGPVTVLGQSGKVLLVIDEHQGQPRLILGGEGGVQLQLQAGAEGRLSLVRGNDEGFVVTLGGEGPALVLGSGGAQARLAQAGDAVTLDLGGVGSPQVSLSSTGGKANLLTLGKAGGKTLVLKQEGDDATLTLGGSDAPDVTLGATPQGGELLLGGTEAEAKVQLSSNDNGGELQLGQAEGLRVQLGTRGQEAVVQVVSGEDRAALSVGGELVGLLARTRLGAAIVGQAENQWGLRLSKDNRVVALLGAAGGAATGLNLYGAGSEATVTLRGEGAGGALLLGTGGKDAPIVLSTTGAESQLLLGKEATPYVKIVSDGSDAGVGVYDGSDFARLYIDDKDTAFVTSDSGGQAALGKYGGGWGVNLMERDKLIAGLGRTPGRGVALRMFDEGGEQVGAFGASPEGSGGTLRIYSGGSGATVSLGAESGAGLVHVFDAGGAPVLAMSGSDPAFVVYNAGGTGVAHLGYSSSGNGGNVTTADGGGTNVFSAGAASDGGGEACVVRQGGKGYCLGVGLPGLGTGQ